MKVRDLFLILCIGALFTVSLHAEEKVVNVYSARKEQLIQPLLEKFSNQTGIKVNFVTGDADALLERLKSEGINSPADVLITVDAGRLYRAQKADVIQPISSTKLNTAIPAHLREAQGYWYGLTYRARPIMYVKGKVNPAELSTYEDLGDAKWKGKVCIRSSDNIYNQSLVASMVATLGTDTTEAWAKRFVLNFARKPQGGDRDQIGAAAAGQCDIAIANTYYLAQMLADKDPAQNGAAKKLGVFWPNQKGRGTHINISGAAVTKHAKNKENAIKLLEFMVTNQAQDWYAKTNHEYPVKAGVPVSSILKGWGPFKADALNLSKLGEFNAEAVKVMDRADWK